MAGKNPKHEIKTLADPDSDTDSDPDGKLKTPEAWQVSAPGERSEPGVRGTIKHGLKPWRGGRKTAADPEEKSNNKLEAYAAIWPQAG